jgi:hypothetical protein
MSGQVSTPNMAEVLYLLDRRHRIVDVGLQATWPYGIEELCVTLEGENIDLDHRCYLLHGECRLSELRKAFDAVMSVVWRKDEERAAGGAL